MTKRLYYTDPIKALYMMKEFGVKFINPLPVMDNLIIDYETYSNLSILIGDLEHITKRFGNAVVHKESEHILKPKEGDLVTDGDLFGKVCSKSPYEDVLAFSIDDEGATRTVSGSEAKIIMKDNKQFFMTEVEND